MNPFEYVNAINYSKKDIMVDDVAEKAYNSFMVNRSLSYFPDTVLFANEMNQVSHIDNRLSFSFLINTVRKRKRFAKWAKPLKESDLEVVKQYYGYNNEKARNALTLLSNEQINELRKKVDQGGRRK